MAHHINELMEVSLIGIPSSLPLPSLSLITGLSPSLQALKSLVDYDEDSDEEDKADEQTTESQAKRKKLDDT